MTQKPSFLLIWSPAFGEWVPLSVHPSAGRAVQEAHLLGLKKFRVEPLEETTNA